MDVNMGVTTEKKNNHSDLSQQVQITQTTSGNLKQLPPVLSSKTKCKFK